MLDEFNFGAIIRDCKYFFSSFFTNFNLARVAMSLVSLHIFIDIPICIQNLIINEML